VLIACPPGTGGNYILPDSVQEIKKNAFYACPNLIGVTIGNSVTTIGSYAFRKCSSLTNLTIGSSVTEIGMSAFSRCSSLTQVVIPDSVTEIGDSAFLRCENLTHVTIPVSVTLLSHTFCFCSNLETVYCKGDAPSIDAAFGDTPSSLTVYYMRGATGWSSSFGGRPTKLWAPKIKTDQPDFGIHNNCFEFTIGDPDDLRVVVEKSEKLDAPSWTPVSTNILSGSFFSDAVETNKPACFYRLRML